MSHIKITKGLDIPIKGKPAGPVQPLFPSGSASSAHPTMISLNLSSFEDVKFRLLAREDDLVKVGQPLAEDKSTPGRMFCSPAGGVVKEIRRGYRRSLVDIVIEVSRNEELHQWTPLSIEQASREELISRLNEGGVFASIYSRPFNFLADPAKIPRSIFVRAIESAPFAPSPELQIEGHEAAFQAGLDVLAKLTSGKVHLVYKLGSTCSAFTAARNVELHTAEGPHPIGNASIHIHQIDPIKSSADIVWVIDAHRVVEIGALVTIGRAHIERVISIAGPGVVPDRIGYYKTRAGIPVSSLVSGRVPKQGLFRLISGDPLTGKKVESEGFLGFSHYVFCVIPENSSRDFLHFFRLGSDKYSFSRAYASGHFDNSRREYDFTTSMHGEHRAFIDSTLYDKVMPLPISTMLLVKAVMAEDFDLAEALGLLSVDSEDFALPTFVCPSKMEMIDIVKGGLKRYAHEVLGAGK